MYTSRAVVVIGIACLMPLVFWTAGCGSRPSLPVCSSALQCVGTRNAPAPGCDQPPYGPKLLVDGTNGRPEKDVVATFQQRIEHLNQGTSDTVDYLPYKIPRKTQRWSWAALM